MRYSGKIKGKKIQSRDLFSYYKHLYSYDGTWVIGKNNPVKTLTREQIRTVYMGEITNWKELGEKDHRRKWLRTQVRC